MIGFLSLFSIMLEFFFLSDMVLTWVHPIKYLSGQKHVVPIFLLGSKFSQFILFAIFQKYGVINQVNMTTVSLQIAISFAFFAAVLARQKQNQYSSNLSIMILLQYTLPHLSFCFMIFAIINQSFKD